MYRCEQRYHIDALIEILITSTFPGEIMHRCNPIEEG